LAPLAFFAFRKAREIALHVPVEVG
jgi:hypothetical protein